MLLPMNTTFRRMALFNIILPSTPEIFFPSLWNLVKTQITTTTTTAAATTTIVDAARFLF